MMITTREQLIRTSRVAASMLPNTRGGTATVAIPTSFQTTSKHQDRQHLDGISEAEERQGRHHGGTLTHPSFTRDAASFCGRVRPTVHRDRFHLRPDGAGCFADKHDYFAPTHTPRGPSVWGQHIDDEVAHHVGLFVGDQMSSTRYDDAVPVQGGPGGWSQPLGWKRRRTADRVRAGNGPGAPVVRARSVIHSTWSGDGVCPGPFAQKRGEELC